MHIQRHSQAIELKVYKELVHWWMIGSCTYRQLGKAHTVFDSMLSSNQHTTSYTTYHNCTSNYTIWCKCYFDEFDESKLHRQNFPYQ